MFPPLKLPPALVDEMIDQARLESPNECCGLLAGRRRDDALHVTRRFPLVNVAATPTCRFESSPESMLRAVKMIRQGGLEIAAVYHSHPRGGDQPSALDRQLCFSPRTPNLIIDLSHDRPRLAAWYIDGDDVVHCPIILADQLAATSS